MDPRLRLRTSTPGAHAFIVQRPMEYAHAPAVCVRRKPAGPRGADLGRAVRRGVLVGVAARRVRPVDTHAWARGAALNTARCTGYFN
jgi:hypothetical protein